jgi:hypothetical protein
LRVAKYLGGIAGPRNGSPSPKRRNAGALDKEGKPSVEKPRRWTKIDQPLIARQAGSG